uniref:Uncharacterized protein n=1 Tax=Globodera rostochiensis TaxID=31243 RepID=A0A914IFQ5_GLORO
MLLIFANCPLTSFTAIGLWSSLRSVGFSTVYALGRDALSFVFADYPRARKMVLRRATQLQQRHERKMSKMSTGSAALFRRRSVCLSPFRDAEDSDQAATSLEERTADMRHAIWAITGDVERMESNFVINSMAMKQQMTSLEKEFIDQKPKLKARLESSKKIK